MREAEGEKAGGYSTSVIERLEGGELARIHGGGSDTKGTQPATISQQCNREERKRKSEKN